VGKAVTQKHLTSLPFNSPFETGLRSVAILVAAFPRALDLHRLVIFDHLVVHTGDVGGPDSLHPPVPMRSTEILVRRHLVERGLLLMLSRGLLLRTPDESAGIVYRAGDFAETFLNSLSSPYLAALRERTHWLVETFADLSDEEISARTGPIFDRWVEQFQLAHNSLAGDL
jgi:hypothetical protein